MAIQRKIIPFCKPSIGEEEIEAVSKVLRSGWLAAGTQTEAFEKEFAEYVGVKYAIFTSSCTSALKMAYKYFKEQGFTTYDLHGFNNTFCATYAAAEEMGLKRDDVGYKAIRVTVHYGGVVKFLATKKHIDIEDSAHRIEPNDPLIGKIRCYSFYATKNMTTGSGGMLVTNNKDIYERCRLYWKDGLSTSTHERQKKGYEYEILAMAGGYDGNDIAASIGRVQLRKLPEFTQKRNEIVAKYNEAFKKDWKGNHLYPYGKDKKLIDYLAKKGIRAGYFYPPNGFVCLPIYPSLTNSEVNYIIKNVQDWNKNKSRG